MSLALSYVTSILSLLFAASLLAQYMKGKQTYHLLWAIAFMLFSMAMGLWFLRESFGLNQWIFRLWYLSGTMLAATYLGTGMLFMIAPRRVAGAFTGYLLVVTVAAVVLVLTAHIKTPDECVDGLKGLGCLAPSDTLTKMGFFPPWIRVLGAMLNLYGGLAVVAAAVWSIRLLVRQEADAAGQPSVADEPEGVAGKLMRALAGSYRNTVTAVKLLWQNRDFWRRGAPAQRAASNIILTIGVALAALGATLNSLDSSEPHLGLFLGAVLIIYVGVLDIRAVIDSVASMQPRRSLEDLWSTGLGRLPFRRTSGGDLQ